MKHFPFAPALGALGALALAAAQPAFAQDVPDEQPDEASEFASDGQSDVEMMEPDFEKEMGTAVMGMMGAMVAQMFQPAPLEPAAEARLPDAQVVAGQLVPEGVLGAMMGQLIDSITGPVFTMMGGIGGMSSEELAGYTGIAKDDVDTLSEEQREELTEIFDPVYETRTTAEIEAITGVLNQAFVALEPGMREGLARAYAGHFSDAELAELQAFFATPTGAKFAAQSLPSYSDAQVIAGMMQSAPALMMQMPQLIEQVEGADLGLPEPRRYDDLTPSEQRRAAELLGVDQATLRARMAEAELATAEGAEAESEEGVDAAEADDSFEDAMEDVGTK